MRALLAAGGISLFISLFATPGFIAIFRSLNWGQFIRDDGPEAHHTKRGTPTMGGIVILAAAVIHRNFGCCGDWLFCCQAHQR